MKLRIVMASKIKDSAVQSICSEYEKRLQAYGDFRITEPAGSARRKQEDALSKGAEGYIVGMDPKGKQMSSEQFAVWLEDRFVSHGAVSFLIGEAEGLDSAARAASKELISLSNMTMAHRVSLIVLAEQLYRAMTIIKGHPYHK